MIVNNLFSGQIYTNYLALIKNKYIIIFKKNNQIKNWINLKPITDAK